MKCVIFSESLKMVELPTLWPDWEFWKIIGIELTYKSGPNVLWLFAPFWKTSF